MMWVQFELIVHTVDEQELALVEKLYTDRPRLLRVKILINTYSHHRKLERNKKIKMGELPQILWKLNGTHQKCGPPYSLTVWDLPD